ncbi:MAG: hypothetical protein QF380_02025 [Candidatus Marinimicrobia bacterium]|nr:hypothetical protein [Candidatus Neomarinimicrobiota bacterium]
MRKPYLYILAICFFSCEEPPVFEAPDPVETPVVAIQTIETIFTKLPIEIVWEGNTTSREFIYELQYVDDPSIVHSWNELDTTGATSVTFDNLDEGNYIFTVRGLYNQDNIGSEVTLSFEVDAISGPALRIYPLSQTAKPGDEIDVYLYFEDVPENLSVTGLHVDIRINTDELEFINDQFVFGELVTDFSGTAIYPDPIFSSGAESVSIVGVADENGLGVYGTGSIAKLRLRVKDQVGSFQINIYQPEDAFQNINGDWHGFGDPVSGTVTVEEAE